MLDTGRKKWLGHTPSDKYDEDRHETRRGVSWKKNLTSDGNFYFCFDYPPTGGVEFV